MHLRSQTLWKPGYLVNSHVLPQAQESIQGSTHRHDHAHGHGHGRGQPEEMSYKSRRCEGRKHQPKSENHDVFFLRLAETKGGQKSKSHS